MATAITLGATSCSKKLYSVDYSGEKFAYKDANKKQPKDKYRAGEKVKLYYDMVATDTSYEFYIDGKRINPDFTWETGFIIEFVMPEHDVKIDHTERNTMLYDPHEKAE